MRLRPAFVQLVAALLLAMIPVSAHLYAQDDDNNAQVTAAVQRLNQLIPGIGAPDSVGEVIQQPTVNANLGCASAPGSALARTVLAYRVPLVYGDTTYVFYVSEDLAQIVGCDNVPTAVQPPQAEPTSPPSQNLNCLLTSTNSALVQSLPGTGPSAVIIGQIARNRVYTVQGQATSSTGVLWYRIAFTGTQNGWVEALQSSIAGPDCTIIPTVDVSFATPPQPTLSPSTTPPSAPSETQPPAPADTTTTPTATAPPAAFPDSNCPAGFVGFLPTQFSDLGQAAQIVAGATLPLRAEPSLQSTNLGTLQAATGQVLVLDDGPSCTNGVVWWQVSGADTRVGWVPESSVSTNSYFLEPVAVEPPTDPPTTATATAVLPDGIQPDATRITATNASALASVQTLALDTTPRSALAVTDGFVAVISDARVDVYDYPALTLNTNLTDTLAAQQRDRAADTLPTALQFDRFGSYLAVGYADGAVTLLELEQAVIVTLAAAHTAPVSSISFDPENRTMLSVSGAPLGLEVTATDYSVVLWDLSTFDAAAGTMATLYDMPTAGPVLDATFTRSGIPVLRVVGSVIALDEAGIPRARLALDEAGIVRARSITPAPTTLFDDEDTVLYSVGESVGAWNVVLEEGIGGFVQGGPLAAIDLLLDEESLLLTATGNTLTLQNTANDAAPVVVSLSFEQAIIAVALAPSGDTLLILDGFGLNALQVIGGA